VAKKNVFPLCQNGAKVFTPQEKKEGGLSLTKGIVSYSETNDPDIIFTEFTTGAGYAGEYFIQSRDKAEYLLDLREGPQTDLAVNNGTEPVYTTFNSQSPNDTNVTVWEDINNKEDRGPLPGSIICLARKKNSNAAWISNTLSLLTIFLGFGVPGNTAPFKDDESLSASNKLNASEIEDGQWLTYMFTGSRYVFLGSNNWY